MQRNKIPSGRVAAALDPMSDIAQVRPQTFAVAAARKPGGNRGSGLRAMCRASWLAYRAIAGSCSKGTSSIAGAPRAAGGE
jgi:hypothetical protein